MLQQWFRQYIRVMWSSPLGVFLLCSYFQLLPFCSFQTWLSYSSSTDVSHQIPHSCIICPISSWRFLISNICRKCWLALAAEYNHSELLIDENKTKSPYDTTAGILRGEVKLCDPCVEFNFNKLWCAIVQHWSIASRLDSSELWRHGEPKSPKWRMLL